MYVEYAIYLTLSVSSNSSRRYGLWVYWIDDIDHFHIFILFYGFNDSTCLNIFNE